MCVVSMVGDHYAEKWREVIPQIQPFAPYPQIGRNEFEQLKRDVEEMKELLKRAKAYDAATGQPDCELDSKLAVLRKVAELVGVNLDDVLKPAAQA